MADGPCDLGSVQAGSGQGEERKLGGMDCYVTGEPWIAGIKRVLALPLCGVTFMGLRNQLSSLQSVCDTTQRPPIRHGFRGPDRLQAHLSKVLK